MRARKAVSRKGWLVARSPKLPPSILVMVSITRWVGAREAKAWLTLTTVGRATSSVMDRSRITRLVLPAVGVEGGGGGSLEAAGRGRAHRDRGREQVAALRV